MKLENIVSHTEFVRDHKKFSDALKKGDVVVVKNNKPTFIAVQPENYKKHFEKQMEVIKEYKNDKALKLAFIIQTIKAKREELLKEGVEHVYIFGSYARGEERDNSDIDILYDSVNTGWAATRGSDVLDNLFPGKDTRSIPAQMAKQDFVKAVKEYAIQIY